MSDKEAKKQKVRRKNGDSHTVREQEDGRQDGSFDVMNKFDQRKKKRRKDCERSQDNDSKAMMIHRCQDDLVAKKTKENENESRKTSGLVKEKRRKASRFQENAGDSSIQQLDDMSENVDEHIQPTMPERNTLKKHERKKKRKHEKMVNSEDSSSFVQPADINVQDFADNNGDDLSGMDKSHSEVENTIKRKKKKSKPMDDTLNHNIPSKSNRKVRFSDHVEVFPSPADSNSCKWNDKETSLVRGKRCTKEEDEIIKAAVYKYIEDHNLGEDGLEMVLNSRKHRELRGLWREIGAALPYRPFKTSYYRAQVIFRRSETRKWTEEEYAMILKYQEQHGNAWKALADELGKHRWHVKDTWRRIKLANVNKGNWAQKEYQALFNLVNTDLQLRVSEEKKSKCGMLKDNICWTSISDKLATRPQALCCQKWYNQLTSPMVAEGIWADTDDYLLLRNLFNLDAGCVEDVDWDNLIDHRSGALCKKRWNQMVLHIGCHGNRPFSEQVDTLARRYCPHLLEVREAWDSKPRVP